MQKFKEGDIVIYRMDQDDSYSESGHRGVGEIILPFVNYDVAPDTDPGGYTLESLLNIPCPGDAQLPRTQTVDAFTHELSGPYESEHEAKRILAMEEL